MKILLSNDDGIDAPGLWHAFDALRDHDCEIVAPLHDQSGASHSSACFRLPLSVERRVVRGVDALVVAGTPSDAVKFRLCETSDRFDAMVSGINAGENGGVAQYYSGTVAAAREAALRGVPAVAISVWRDAPEHYRAAAEFLKIWVPRWFSRPDPETASIPRLLNVNFPECSPAGIRGVYIAQQSTAHYDDHFESFDNGASGIYNVVFGNRKSDQILPGSDDWALRQGYVTVVPLRLDTTCSEGVSWLRTMHGETAPAGDSAVRVTQPTGSD